jgi:hypothetical protein
MIKPHKTKALYALVAAALVLWAIADIARASRIPKHFEQIAIGDSRDRVLELMGKPKTIEKCGEPFGGKTSNPGCKEDYLFASPFAPFVPEYWSVSLDDSGRVINKYHYVSP